MELNPNYAPAHEYYAWLLIGLGKRAEGLAEICTAAELDPLSSQIAFEDGWHLYQSLTALKRSEAILGDNPSPPLAEEARVYAMSGRRAKALEALDRLRALAKHAQVSKYVIAVVYAALGDKDMPSRTSTSGSRSTRFC